MADYAAFARFYDDIVGDRSEEIDRIRSYISLFRPGAKRLLELGCGTGAVLTGLGGELEVAGVDRSPEMLAIAADRLPGARLVEADMTRFRLDALFDVVICVFDTLNHLPRFDLWLALFDRAREHLTEGGLFIFDVNTVGRMRGLHATPQYVEDFGGGVFSMQVRPGEIRPGEGEVSVWTTTISERRRDGGYQQHVEPILELAVPLHRIRTALAAGFEPLHEAGLDDDDPSDESDRVYFCYRRTPGGPQLR
ncbi:MAG TPA: class I SAM-dependent methyltransferase [Streptosporangiaceae bacterium]|jgi:SAM-dependent methyltransferase